MKDLPPGLLRHRFLLFLEVVLISALLAMGIGVSFYVHNTLTKVRQGLPAEILRQTGEINRLLQELDDLGDALDLAELEPGPPHRQAVIARNQTVQETLQAIRNSYVLDNLLGAAAVHALVSPAAEDIQRWLTEGLPGLSVDAPLLMRLARIRARDVHARTLALSRQANAQALELLAQESQRLERFRGAMLLLLTALLVLALSVLHLFLRKRRMEARLATLREQLSAAVESIPEGFVLCDARDHLVMCNESYRRLYACVQELITPGVLYADLVRAFVNTHLIIDSEGREEELVAERMTRHYNPGAHFDYELRDGRRIRVSERRTRDGGVVGIHADMTDIRRTQEHLRYLASHDPLTGLVNRGYCQERLDQALARARRHRSRFALLYLDLDRFKWVNDTLGHQVGDTLLQAVAKRLKSSLRDEDILARLGGDEFMAVLEDLSGPVAALASAQRLIQALATPFQIGAHEIFVATSIGIACYPDHGSDIETLMRHADLAGYYAKSQGINHYCLYAPELNTTLSQRIQ